jgi:site-specific recombinase XerD
MLTLPSPIPAQPDPALAKLYESYQASRPLGPENKTAGNYEGAWRPFVAHLQAKLDREPRLSDLTTEALNRYLLERGCERNWSEQSVKTNGSNIRSVVSGMRRHQLVPRDTLLDFELPRVTEEAPVYFDDATLALIFGRLESSRTTRNLRLRAVLQIMLDCGARPEELAALTMCDLRQDTSRLHIRGKGAKNRMVPVGQTTWVFLDDYMRVRPAPFSPSERVFVPTRGKAACVTPSTLASDMRDLLVDLRLVGGDAPVDQGYRLYSMRKTFAHRAAEGGMDVGELAAIMGHEPNSIPMLLRLYYRPSDLQKQAAHASARPAESFHEWRASGQPSRAKVERPLSYFERWSSRPVSTRGGYSPSSRPSSRSRTRGE